MATVLNSWKEIAAYLGRGVRTAQRWERDLALPVRRPRGTDRSAVFAVPAEIDGWLKRCPARALANSAAAAAVATSAVVTVQRPALHKWQVTHRNADLLNRGAQILQERTLRLQQQVERAILLGKRLTNPEAKKSFQLPSAS
jgi:hypothetical protein